MTRTDLAASGTPASNDDDGLRPPWTGDAHGRADARSRLHDSALSSSRRMTFRAVGQVLPRPRIDSVLLTSRVDGFMAQLFDDQFDQILGASAVLVPLQMPCTRG